MQGQSNPQADEYKPKWRHFHPQATVWVLNPFDHDVIWRVADENNNQSEFRIQARERAELPGGAIATLGVKAIVDEMIQASKEDAPRLYMLDVRARYEEKIILRVKEAPAAVTASAPSGPIDLSIGKADNDDEQVQAKQEEKPFEEVPVNKMHREPEPVDPGPLPEKPPAQEVKVSTSPPLDAIASASTSGQDQIVESD